jgi:Late exocytosis, associated with Golgi transport/Cytosolic domain of 10TM putative phosphate transporter
MTINNTALSAESIAALDAASTSAKGGILIVVLVGCATIVVCLVLFEFLRRMIPAVYEYRRLAKEQGKHKGYYGEDLELSQAQPGLQVLGWIVPTLSLTPETLEQSHGLDVAMMVLFVRTRAILFFGLTILACVVLLPVYATADNKDLAASNELKARGLEIFSLANVPSTDSWRFWICFAVQIASVGMSVAAILVDFRAYDAARRRYRTTRCPSNYSIMVHDIPADQASPEGVYKYWNILFPGEIEHVHLVRDASSLVKKKVRFWNAVTQREVAEWMMAYKTGGARPTHKDGPLCGKTVVDSIDTWTQRQEHYRAKIHQYQGETRSEHLPHLNAAIVVFRTKQTASVASQVLFAQKESVWRTTRAPEPAAVNYASLRLGQPVVRKAITAASILALTFFWAIPVTLIQGLANLTALSEIEVGGTKPFAFLTVVVSWSPGFISLIEVRSFCSRTDAVPVG